jgi:hypothetical protein
VSGLRARGVSGAVLMNANYEREISGIAAASGLRLNIVIA